MRRLYLQIYVALIGSLILFFVLASVAWFVHSPDDRERELLEGIGTLLGEQLPGADSSREELQAALEGLHNKLPAQLSLFGADGALLAAVGDPLSAPPPRARTGWRWSRGRGATAVFELENGRWLVARHPPTSARRALGGLATLALLALAVAGGSFPVVRRLTRRLERLQARVDRLGAGELSARVEVEGKDEVASLARSFNRAADRIERLMQAQRSMLANASHELRTPLTRIRMALELMGDDGRPELRERVAKDIAELDDLIEEILLSSRLEALNELGRREEVDLLALVAEEAARAGAQVSGAPVRLQGDARLLRRLVRNLLENARHHAGGSAVEASVSVVAGEAVLEVADRGPGVPEEERGRIFEPFYRPAGRSHGARSSEGGVGLGLALVRQIARRHGGDVRCLPRDGGGTRFEVTLRVP